MQRFVAIAVPIGHPGRSSGRPDARAIAVRAADPPSASTLSAAVH
jgi:hypothetical protein